MNIRRNRAAIFSLLATGVLLGSLAAAPSAAEAASSGLSAQRPVALPASVAPRVLAGAERLGAVAAAQQIHVDVELKVRDQAALTAYLDGLANRKSPYFHHF
ncbi:MAG: hypothetical protein JWM19_6483, partial [Actinomycetia bacterium]|nr:hypothetical protein [Actinomycetes bacterium]